MVNLHVAFFAGCLLVSVFGEYDGIIREYGHLPLSRTEEAIVIQLVHQMGVMDIEKIMTSQGEIYRDVCVKEAETRVERIITYRVVCVKYQKWVDEDALYIHKNRQAFLDENVPRKGDIQSGDFWTGPDYVCTRKLTLLYVNDRSIRIDTLQNVSIPQAEDLLRRFIQGQLTLLPTSPFVQWLETERVQMQASGEWEILTEKQKSRFTQPIQQFLRDADLYKPEAIIFYEDTQRYTIIFDGKGKGVSFSVRFILKDDKIYLLNIGLSVE